MKINIYNKIFNYLSNEILEKHLGQHKEPKARKIIDLNELEEILLKAGGVNLHLLKTLGNIKNIRAEEWEYANGLKYIICELDYTNNNGEIKTIEKRILTADFLTNPIMMLDFTKDKVALEQFLIPKSTSLPLFPQNERVIEIKEISISLNGLCIACFKEVKNLQTNQLLKEEYLQYYPIINGKGTAKALINLCGCGERKLEILYHNSNPVFADLSGKHTIEMVGYNTNNIEDIQKIIAIINEEVDAIIQKISSSIKIYAKENKSKEKIKIKTNT